MKIKGAKQNALYIKIIKFYKQINIMVMEKKELDCIEYGGNDTICRKIKRKSTQYKNDYRIWHDYAGDYRTK